jgi:hypothetical protein
VVIAIPEDGNSRLALKIVPWDWHGEHMQGKPKPSKETADRRTPKSDEDIMLSPWWILIQASCGDMLARLSTCSFEYLLRIAKASHLAITMSGTLYMPRDR